MQYIGHFQEIGILLLLGIGLLGWAAFAANPFEHATVVPLYTAIHQYGARYRWVNLLAAAGVIILFVGFGALAWLLQRDSQPMIMIGIVLLGIAAILWVIEVTIRITTTTATARDVVQGLTPPLRFPKTIGIGLEALFIAFLVLKLVGIAALIWGLGDIGMLSSDLTRAGVVVLVASGVFTAKEYPFLGGVERILFYPLVGVVLPLALILLQHS